MGECITSKATSCRKRFTRFAGQAYKGAHLATILLRPRNDSRPQGSAPDTASWPNLRDVANLLLGFLGIAMLRFIIALIEAL